jgi:hypothetical protein
VKEGIRSLILQKFCVSMNLGRKGRRSQWFFMYPSYVNKSL